MHKDDTIAAVSTPPGQGGIGIVRMSGPDALGIAERIFRPRHRPECRSHRLVYGQIVDPSTGESVDEVLVSEMHSPNTYTREDVVEINCHGGLVPLRRVLELCLSNGARLAEPGEFTKRAFLNGRIDLAQAEAALDLIRAKTETAERLAMRQLSGGLSQKIRPLIDRLTDICAHVEAHIDFPEDEIEPAAVDELLRGMDEVASGVRELSESFNEGRVYREGVRAVIAGRPNVGKSSLLNALLMRDRAIVTEQPGTTRDVLEECLNVNGIPVVVVDTAGIRQAHDMAEAEGVRRSMQALEEADIVLGVLDSSEPLHDGDKELMSRLEGRSAVLVLNKADLKRADDMLPETDIPCVEVSARTGEGLDALKEAVAGACLKSPAASGEGVLVTNVRHKQSLDAAGHSLGEARYSVQRGAPMEIMAVELRDALDRLGEVVGAVTTEDILDRIFSEFCIGK